MSSQTSHLQFTKNISFIHTSCSLRRVILRSRSRSNANSRRWYDKQRYDKLFHKVIRFNVQSLRSGAQFLRLWAAAEANDCEKSKTLARHMHVPCLIVACILFCLSTHSIDLGYSRSLKSDTMRNREQVSWWVIPWAPPSPSEVKCVFVSNRHWHRQQPYFDHKAPVKWLAVVVLYHKNMAYLQLFFMLMCLCRHVAWV